MKNKIISFCIVFFLQVVIFEKTYFFNSVIFSPIIFYFIIFNYTKNSFSQLTFSFIVGFLLDIFSNSPGVYSFALSLMVFIRNFWIPFYFPFDRISSNKLYNSYELGFQPFLFYSFPLIFTFNSAIYIFDLSSVGFFPFFILKILLSTFLNFILVLILQFLLLSSDTKYDWN